LGIAGAASICNAVDGQINEGSVGAKTLKIGRRAAGRTDSVHNADSLSPISFQFETRLCDTPH